MLFIPPSLGGEIASSATKRGGNTFKKRRVISERVYVGTLMIEGNGRYGGRS